MGNMVQVESGWSHSRRKNRHVEETPEYNPTHHMHLSREKYSLVQARKNALSINIRSQRAPNGY